MTRLTSPYARWMLATVMVVALPFCCCNGRLVTQAYGGLAAIHTVAHGSLYEGTGNLHHQEADPGPGQGCHSSGKSDGSTPCDDDGPCDCEQHKQVKQVPDRSTTVDFSWTLIAVLPGDERTDWIPEPPTIARFSPGAVPRPPTSLLRLHCALIV